MTQWAATEMPRWRQGLIKALAADPDRYRGWPGRLAEADLYWVTRDMTMVAYDAIEHVAPFIPAAVVPSPTGLLLWNAQLPTVPLTREGMRQWRGKHPPAAGVIWAQHSGRIDLWLLARLDVTAELFQDTSFRPHPDTPMVLPVTELTLGPASETVDLSDGDEWPRADVRDMVGLVVMTWELMQQPTVATPRRVTGAGGSSRAFTTQTRAVTIVDLRRMEYVREDHEPSTGRSYRHRWLVGTHPRMQPYGPGRSLVKRIWIAPYIKGPEGAPLVQRERVHVWRR